VPGFGPTIMESVQRRLAAEVDPGHVGVLLRLTESDATGALLVRTSDGHFSFAAFADLPEWRGKNFKNLEFGVELAGSF
jgi:hypothetical protein